MSRSAAGWDKSSRLQKLSNHQSLAPSPVNTRKNDHLNLEPAGTGGLITEGSPLPTSEGASNESAPTCTNWRKGDLHETLSPHLSI